MRYPEIRMKFEAFDLIRLGKNSVYNAVDTKLQSYGGFENWEVLNMNLIPESIEDQSVVYRIEILQTKRN